MSPMDFVWGPRKDDSEETDAESPEEDESVGSGCLSLLLYLLTWAILLLVGSFLVSFLK